MKEHVGEEVTLRGWLYNKRGSGKIAFLQLRDGSGVGEEDARPEIDSCPISLVEESKLKNGLASSFVLLLPFLFDLDFHFQHFFCGPKKADIAVCAECGIDTLFGVEADELLIFEADSEGLFPLG